MDEEIQSILEKRVIDCSVDDKFDQLAKEGQSPVSLFQTRKACNEFNTLMLINAFGTNTRVKMHRRSRQDFQQEKMVRQI